MQTPSLEWLEFGDITLDAAGASTLLKREVIGRFYELFRRRSVSRVVGIVGVKAFDRSTGGGQFTPDQQFDQCHHTRGDTQYDRQTTHAHRLSAVQRATLLD